MMDACPHRLCEPDDTILLDDLRDRLWGLHERLAALVQVVHNSLGDRIGGVDNAVELLLQPAEAPGWVAEDDRGVSYIGVEVYAIHHPLRIRARPPPQPRRIVPRPVVV